MKRIAANYIYTAETGFLRFGIFVIDDNSKLIEVIDTAGQMKEMHSMEFHSGLMVNCRINNDDLLSYKARGSAKLEDVLNEILSNKPNEGFSILGDVDFSNFSLKLTSTARTII